MKNIHCPFRNVLSPPQQFFAVQKYIRNKSQLAINMKSVHLSS